jgi:hypothetical protein
LVRFCLSRQDNKYKFINFPNLFFACEEGGDKQLSPTVKIAPGLGAFSYICAS